MRNLFLYIFILIAIPGVSQNSYFKSIGGGLNNGVWGFGSDTVNNKLYTYGYFTKTKDNKRLIDIGVWDGAKWDSIHHLVGGILTAFQKVPNKGLFGFGFDLAKLNYSTQTWSTITTTDNGISFLTTYQNDLIIVGAYDNIDNKPIKRIARYDGTTITGFDNTPFMGSISSAVEFQGKLYIGGNFQITNSCGGIRKLAVWDATDQCWKQVGNGVVGSFGGVNKLVVYNNKLIVAGSFFKSDGNYGNCIFSYDGQDFNDLGGGFTGTNDQIKDMIIYKGKLILTGIRYSNLPSTSSQASNIFSFDGNNFCNYFSYQNSTNSIGATEIFRDTLVFSTFSTKIGNDTVNYVAKYLGNFNNPLECVNVVGIKEIEQVGSTINVYPNPAKDYVTLEFNSTPFQLTVHNNIGELILNDTITEDNVKINCQDWPTGIYIFKVRASSEARIVKIVISK